MKKCKASTCLIAPLFIGLLYPTALFAESIAIEASLKLLHFNYEEFSLSGETFNEENGVIPGLSLTASSTVTNFTHSLGFELYDGTVNYDGQTQAGTPLTTDTDETLDRLFYRLDWQPESSISSFYGKLAWQQWDRDIQPAGIVSGLFEQYQWWTIEAGVNIPILNDERHSLQFEFGALRTFNGTIEVDLSRQGFGKPKLNLGDGSGLTTAIFYQHRLTPRSDIGLNLQYQYWKFGRSNTETVSNDAILIDVTEPRSVSRHAALSLSYRYQL